MPYRSAYTPTNSDGYIAKRDAYVKGYKKTLLQLLVTRFQGGRWDSNPRPAVAYKSAT